jgi:hypothetical protein
MHTFAQKTKTTQQITPEKSVVPSRAHLGQSRSILHLQRTIGNQAVLPQLLQTKSDGLEAVSNATISGHFGYDFSRIPVFSTDAATRPAAGLAPRVEFQRERSVEMPGEEEQGADGGTAAPKAPAPAPAPAPAGCDCVPSGVQIKNVSATRSGKLYGHKFDVAIDVGYFAAASGPGTDAQLFWFEKSDRPPAWYGVGPNVWTDLVPLFPGSPTFNGWTKSRTKPCPGSETATLTDPPAASVDLPARTIEFDIYVRGLHVSHNAKAKQVLEPDGKGGVKTQTFEILPPALGPGAGP